MNDAERKKLEARIRKNCRRLIAECNAILRDFRYWNRINPGEKPFTPDDELIKTIEQKRWAEAMLRKLDEAGPADKTN